MLKRLARWIVRDELEQAHVERAEAVNHALNLYRSLEDARGVARDRGNALQAALRVYGAEAAKAAISAKMWSDEHKQGAIQAIEWYRCDGVVSAGGAK